MNDKLKNKVVTIVFMAMIIIFMIINIVKKDTTVSLTERRKLATFPEFSIEKLFDKTFIDGFDKYTMDQFVKRDEFRKIKTFFELKYILFNFFGKKSLLKDTFKSL